MTTCDFTPAPEPTVHIDVPKWGRYSSDADLFAREMLRTRASLLTEVLDRCVEERGDSSHLRTLRKVHLAGMLADFATGNRRNGWDDVPATTETAPTTTTQTGGSTEPTSYLPAVRKLANRQWEARLDQTDDKYAYPPAYEVYEVIGVYVTRDEAIGQAQRRYREMGGK